jgi:hypothetical protein
MWGDYKTKLIRFGWIRRNGVPGPENLIVAILPEVGELEFLS